MVISMEKIELKTAIQYAIDGKAILFTGAGFSYGAKNIIGENFPLGNGLRDILADEVAKGSTSDLASVAQYYIQERGAQSLISLLMQTFTLKDATLDHEIIMSLPWKRIYSTNYDLLAETVSGRQGYHYMTVTLSSDCDSPALQKACVHLNGSITNLTPNTLMKEFKLTDASYDADELRGHPWFDFMIEDFKSAKAIVIVGFGKKHDVDISRIIAEPTFRGKVIFINKKGMDIVEASNLSRLGNVYEIGLDGLATEIENVKRTYVSSPVSKFVFDSFLHEKMSPAGTSKATMQELTGFYYQGQQFESLFGQDATGDYRYIASREALNVFFNNLSITKAFIVVAALGNGKSVFCQLVRQEMRSRDMDVYTYLHDSVDIDAEIEAICQGNGSRKRLVIIDDYNKHMLLMKKFAYFGSENLIFLLTTRRSSHMVNYERLLRTLDLQPDALRPLFLDNLSETEMSQLAFTLENNKMLPAKLSGCSSKEVSTIFSDECKGHMADIVLYLFDSSQIKNELSSVFTSSSHDEDTAVGELCILGLANSLMKLELSFSDMISLLKIDYILLGDKLRTLPVGDIFDADSDRFTLVSSVISRKLLYDIIKTEALISVLVKIVIEADRRSPTDKSRFSCNVYRNDRYTELIKAILSHNNFDKFIGIKRHMKSIIAFYEGVRHTTFCQGNPFYWEQFAIVCQKARDYDTVRQCLQNAYIVAKNIPGFVPFQVENIEGGFILQETIDLVQQDNIMADEAVDRMKQAHALLFKNYYHRENNHIKAINYGDRYADLYYEIMDKADKRVFSEYIGIATDMLKKMRTYRDKEAGGFTKEIDDKIARLSKTISDAKGQIKDMVG